MQTGKICILIAGIENLEGDYAIELQGYFGISRYPSRKVGTNFYYVLFDNNLTKRDHEHSPRYMFTEFLVSLGLNGYAYRLDRAHVHGDDTVDYIMKLTPKISTHLDFPRAIKELGKR